MTLKPMLASDWEEHRVQFPVIAQPKIDGVRALNISGKLTGRSLKTFGNRYTTNFFSHQALAGFDGEMAAAEQNHPDLCRLTTSALSAHEGDPWIVWYLFDLVTEDTRNMQYVVRLHYLREQVRQVSVAYPNIAPHLRVVESITLHELDELERYDEANLLQGFEGTIIRDPAGKHKSGRSTVREGGLLRIKRFSDAEGIIVGVEEGQSNGNEATINPLGRTERSSHQDNMIPNGMVGTLQVQLLQPIQFGPTVLPIGHHVTISAGRLDHQDRVYFFRNQHLILGKIAKFQFFPKGVKDKLRFPTFQGFRDKVDM